MCTKDAEQAVLAGRRPIQLVWEGTTTLVTYTCCYSDAICWSMYHPSEHRNCLWRHQHSCIPLQTPSRVSRTRLEWKSRNTERMHDLLDRNVREISGKKRNVIHLESINTAMDGQDKTSCVEFFILSIVGRIGDFSYTVVAPCPHYSNYK